MDKKTIDRLLEIQKLKEAGVLTDSEFEEQKKRILDDDRKRVSKMSFLPNGLFANVQNYYCPLNFQGVSKDGADSCHMSQPR